MKSNILLLITLLSLLSVNCDEQDIMRQLPDCPPFPYNAYSGYLQVSDTKFLHYVFIQSQSDPTTDPLVLWFNGGPGCSSLLGFFAEHGPYIIDDGETHIKQNPFPWNLRANVIYLESPAGVGYSFGSRGEADRNHNDMSTSEDAYAALVQFFIKFPDFKQNHFYISGESYAGQYVPYLAWQVYEHNLQSEWDHSITFINMKGMLIGNGLIDYTVDATAAEPETLFNFNIISKKLYSNFKDNNCFFSANGVLPRSGPPQCDVFYAEMQAEMMKLNFYDLYRQTYDTSALELKQESRIGEVEINGEKKEYIRGYTQKEYTPWLKMEVQSPLLGDYVSDYVNRVDVRQAMNIPDTVGSWRECGGITYHQQDGSLWIFPILRHNYKILLYSGDTDGACPTYGTRRVIQKLDWEMTSKWRPWYINDQVAGYVEKYDGLDFATVHGVGHMCPQWKREETTTMITAWLHDEDF